MPDTPHPAQPDRPDAEHQADTWLDAQFGTLDLDPEVLAAMPMADVQAELHEAGLDAGALQQRLQQQVAAPVSASGDRAAADRPARRRPRQRWGALRTAVFACIVFFAASLWLWGVSEWTRPDTYALAEIKSHAPQIVATLQATAAKAPSAVDLQALQQAADLLASAHITTLGLFGSYDLDTVEDAQEHLERAWPEAALAQPLSEAQTLVLFLRAKTHLMREDAAAAEPLLTAVAEHGTAPWQAEAAGLLARLQRPQPTP